MQALLAALLGTLPSARRCGERLLLREPGGSVRVIAVRTAQDPQVEHGLLLAFAPPLGSCAPGEPTLEHCHLRARCRRSAEAVDAARRLATGGEGDADATLLAVEAVRQIVPAWADFLSPGAWVGPNVDDYLRAAVNVAPVHVDALLALVRAGAARRLGRRADAAAWRDQARRSGDARIVAAAMQVADEPG